MTVTIVSKNRLRADVFRGVGTSDFLLILGSAMVVALSAQVAIPLPFTPVPFSLTTLTVLLAGASLGPVRGGFCLLFYLVAGAAGLPWFSQQEAGWQSPSFGYILGFVVAGFVVGGLTRRGLGRLARTAIVMAVGNLLIYLAGVSWLMWIAEVELSQAISLGVLPFLISDAIKVALAVLFLPTAQRLVAVVDRGTL